MTPAPARTRYTRNRENTPAWIERSTPFLALFCFDFSACESNAFLVNQPLPPPIRKSTVPKNRRWLIIGMVVVGAGLPGIYSAHDLYQLHSFPPGYRNRPTSGWHRPGETEFDAANDQIEAFKGTNAFGNSPRAIELAADFSRTLRGQREKFFTGGAPKFEILEKTGGGEFLTYCELHENECAFIVHVPGLRRFEKSVLEDVDARKLLAQLAWQTAQRVLTVHGVGKPKMELAAGLRGLSQYSPIQLGYYDGTSTQPDAGLVKYLDDRTQSHFLWTFFAPESDRRAQPSPK